MVVKLLGLLAALLLLTCLGYGPVRLLLGPAGRRTTWPELLGLSFALGMGVLSCALILYSLSGLRFSVGAVLPLLVLPAMCLLAARQREGLAVDGDETARAIPAGAASSLLPVPVSLGLLIAATCVVFLGCGLEPITEMDAVAHWALHAKAFYHDGSALPPFFTSGGAGEGVSHCPPLFPLVQTWQHMVMGAYDDQLVKFGLPFIYLALLGTVYGGLVRLLPRRFSLALLLVLATLPAMVVPFPAGAVATAYADVPLALYVAAVTGLLVAWVARDDERALVLAALLAAAALWVKREGLAFAGVATIVVLIFSVTTRRGKLWQRLGFAALFIAVVIASLLLQVIYKQHFPGAFTGEDVDLARLLSAEGISRVLTSAGYLLREVVNPTRWGFLWLLLGLFLILRFRLLRDRVVLVPLLLLAGQLAASLVGMALSEFAVERIAQLDMRRVLIQVAPIGTIALALLAAGGGITRPASPPGDQTRA